VLRHVVRFLSGSRLACLESPEGRTRSFISPDRRIADPSSESSSRIATARSGYPPVVPPIDKPEPLTRVQKRELEAELARLEGPGRADAVQSIATARAFGDLSENFEYHAAKNEQGLLERRIALLRDRLDRAVLVDEKAVAASETIGVGSKVELEDDQGERMEVQISSVGGVSPESPVGRALLGRKAGDKVKIQAPSGDWRARVVSVGH
jgi:transcription elongation factor GreA